MKTGISTVSITGGEGALVRVAVTKIKTPGVAGRDIFTCCLLDLNCVHQFFFHVC